MTDCLLWTMVGFMSGSVMYSYIIPKKFYHVDIRFTSEDGNPGAQNAISAIGVPVGMICLALDLLKAFIPVFIAVMIACVSGFYVIPVMMAPILGHAFSPFLAFRGGKALSATMGSLFGIICISKVALIVALSLAFFKFVIDVRPNSAKMITAFVASSIVAVMIEPLLEVRISLFIMSVLICWKQAANPNEGELSVKVGRRCFKKHSKGSMQENKDEGTEDASM